MIASTSLSFPPVCKTYDFSAIAPVISFFLKTVSFYFEILKLLVILICIFNHLFIIWHQRCIIFRVLLIILLVILFVLDKVKGTSVYDLNHKTFVQAIRQLHCDFWCGIPTIESVWKFYRIRRFFQVKIKYNDMMTHTPVLMVIRVYQRLASWIGFRYVALKTTSPAWNI